MNRFPARASAVLAAGLFLALAVAPLAAADHAYSHRLLFYGRVLDDEGRPVVGKNVDLGLDPAIQPEGACADQPGTTTEAFGRTLTRRTTDEFGEFIWCFHAHRLPRVTDAKAHVRIDGTELATVDVDTKFRRHFIAVTLPGDAGQDNETRFDSTYLVSGRLWFAQSRKVVENVDVFGDALDREPVTITFTPSAGGEPVVHKSRTNNYGDFAVRLNVTKEMGAGRITIAGGGGEESFDADTRTRATDVNMQVSNPSRGGWIQYAILAGLVGLLAVGAYYFLGRGKSTAQVRRRER